MSLGGWRAEGVSGGLAWLRSGSTAQEGESGRGLFLAKGGNCVGKLWKST